MFWLARLQKDSINQNHMNMNFSDWHHYYEQRQDHLDHINWETDQLLSPQEKETIYTSIQQFQRGEHSEGHNLLRQARVFARQIQQPDYATAIELFIKEEQRHAMVLARYMRQQSIPAIRGHWVDSIFRSMRKYFTFDISIMVLLTAELISAVYYIALDKATRSGVLKAICRQILIDEDMHISFQCFTLRTMLSERNRFLQFVFRQAQRILLAGTVVVVWWHHNKVLSKGGFDLPGFATACFQQLEQALAMIYDNRAIPFQVAVART